MKPRLLLAEDDPSVQRVAARMVERLGWDLEITASGLTAVEAVIGGSFTVVLLDLGLHDIDGLEVARRIRDRETSRRTPLVAMTGDSGDTARERCLGAGMDDYLAKPLSISTLRAALARWGSTADRKRTPSGEMRVVASLPETLSEHVLLDAAGGDQTLMADVARLFLRDCETRVVELSEAVRASDAAGRIRLAHKLKGAASMVGALRLAWLAEQLEAPAPESPGETSRALVEELHALRRRMLTVAGGA